MPTISIYGLDCEVPELPILSKIESSKLPAKKQKFIRVEWEDMFDVVDRDGEDRPIYTDKQSKFIERELDRITDGYWFMNNGTPTYITGKYYYYLNYWYLENNILPEYRESDRLFFIFFQEAYDDPQILGIVRLKNRRLGATSMGTCISTNIATLDSNKNCGNVSKTDGDAEKMFQDMIVKGFFKLPEFLRPRIDTSSTNKKKLHFIETPRKGRIRGLRKIEGLQSVIDYEATTVGAYDSTRQSFVICDESGKWEKININTYLNVVLECVKEGARKKGFLYFPTTVNEPKKGGANFKIFWDGTDHIRNGRYGTPKKIIRYFQPSWECLGGFIDEYGHSVIEPPNQVTLKYLVDVQEQYDKKERIPIPDLTKGAKRYLQDEYEKLKTEEDRDDFKRKFPFKESDSFSFGSTTSPFNTEKIQKQIDWLTENNIPLVRGRLFADFNTKDIDFTHDAKGNWLFRDFPSTKNNFTKRTFREEDHYEPLSAHKYVIGVDTFRNDRTNELGSMGVIWVGTKFDAEIEDSGELIGCYVGRPNLTELFWKEILMCCMWYGCKAVVEKDATQEYKKYFNNTMQNMLNANCNGFLNRVPDAAIDENRKTRNNNRFDFGVSSADKFVFAKEIELAHDYIETYCHKIDFPDLLMELRGFDPGDRTRFDRSIGFMMWLLGITGETKAKKAQARKTPLIETYAVWVA